MISEKNAVVNVLRGPVNKLEDLVGRSLMKVVVVDNEELHLYLTPDNYVRMYHEQDCCESVYIESIVGDLEDLVNEPILMAEEASRVATSDECSESGTWTFYKFATRKGYVDVRFLGTSNGYYSESVDIEFVDQTDQ